MKDALLSLSDGKESFMAPGSARERLEDIREFEGRLGDAAAGRRHSPTRAAAVVPADRPEREPSNVVGRRPAHQLPRVVLSEDLAVEVPPDHRGDAEHPLQ